MCEVTYGKTLCFGMFSGSAELRQDGGWGWNRERKQKPTLTSYSKRVKTAEKQALLLLETIVETEFPKPSETQIKNNHRKYFYNCT